MKDIFNENNIADAYSVFAIVLWVIGYFLIIKWAVKAMQWHKNEKRNL